MPKNLVPGYPVYWNGDVYVPVDDHSKLYKYSVSRNSWDKLQTPFSDNGDTAFAVIVYEDKLQCIGGYCDHNAHFEKVWEFDESGESGHIPFKESPSIPSIDGLRQYESSYALNFSASSGGQYIAVSHTPWRYKKNHFVFLEIFDGSIWQSVKFSEFSKYDKKQCIHVLIDNDTIFVISMSEIYTASIRDLLKRSDPSDYPWQRLAKSLVIPRYCSNAIVYGGDVVLVNVEDKILSGFAYFSNQQIWTNIGKSSDKCDASLELTEFWVHMVVLPEGAVLLIVTRESNAELYTRRVRDTPELWRMKVQGKNP